MNYHDLKMQRKRWVNRGYMAWLALISMVIVMACLMYTLSIERIEALDSIIDWFFGTMTSIVLAYFGLTTVDTKWMIKDGTAKHSKSEEDKS